MRITALVILTLATLVSGVSAQEPYPTRAISIVVPFPPGGIADLLLWASPPALAAPHIAAGKMRALATWGATRLAAFPGVPTLKELGYDVEYYLWTGLFAPRGIPAGVLQTLRDATRRAVQDEEFKAFWDVDAKRIASVVQFIGKTEAK